MYLLSRPYKDDIFTRITYAIIPTSHVFNTNLVTGLYVCFKI